MKSPGATVCGGCSDDRPGGGRRPVLRRRGCGRRVGAVLRIFTAAAAKKQLVSRSDFCDRHLFQLGVCEFRHLRRRPAAGLSGRDGFGRFSVGMYRGTAAAAGIFLLLEMGGPNFWGTAVSGTNFSQIYGEIIEKTICKMEEMGYNRMEYSPTTAAQSRRRTIWSTKKENAIVWS